MSKYRDKQKILDQETRLPVINRDKNRCHLCRKRPIEVHEIIPKSHFGYNTMEACFEIRNRVCLCRSCHAKAHTRHSREDLLFSLKEHFDYDYSDDPFRQYLISKDYRDNG